MATAGDLLPLNDIEELTPLVRRILGQNPGPYTLQGTNTYLIGRTGGNAILLDTGQGEPAYVPLLRQALSNYSGVSDIILSHHHHDHILGLQQVIPLLKEMGMQAPRIHKLPSKDASLDKPTSDILKELPTDSFHPGSSSLFHHLADNQVFSIDKNAHVSIVHTPGHTDDSISLLFKENDSAHLFTADTVLGQGTAVFTDLKALLDSLQRCINLVDSEDGQRVKLFCGHGPVVQDGVAKMQEYITHRLQREKQVLEALEKAGKPETAGNLVRAIYGPELPDKLVFAATKGIILHLEKLEQDGKVRRITDQGDDSLWELVGRTSKV